MMKPMHSQRETDSDRLRHLLAPSALSVELVSAFSGDRPLTEAEEIFICDLKKKRKERFFSDLLYAVCHQYFHPEIAHNLWKEILQHKKNISKTLKRNVRIIVATLDYLSNFNGDFPLPTLIGENHIFDIVTHSMRDGLTGLFNHTSCYEILDLELKSYERYGQVVSLIILDIDDFKTVNDKSGHQEGDRILKEIAAIIERESRNSDICCRYGGEEFVVILPFTDSREAIEIAERIRVKSMLTLPGGNTMTVSVGVASCDESTTSSLALIEKADIALYRAKKNGKNQVAVGPSVRSEKRPAGDPQKRQRQRRIEIEHGSENETG